MAASLWVAPGAGAQQVAVQSFTLDNGMKFLLVPRTDQPNMICAGWVAKVGSVNERPGITGISHFFEHMMFKGTDTIGTRDPVKDAEFRARQKAVKDRMNQIVWNEQYRRYRLGEIDDPWDPAHDTPELRELRGRLRQLIDEHATIIVKNEFDTVYARHGASDINAFTTNDLTFYFATIPSNKFELWAWMESDRLGNAVFREFYAERDVVHEERRRSVESTPTGVFQEQFDALFWQSSPYSWPVIGWPSDLNSYTEEQAQGYFETYYRPNNLVGVLVGDFDAAAVRPLIRTYFGRLKRAGTSDTATEASGPSAPPPVVTLEEPQTAEKRLYAECDCQPQVEVRYHTVPFNHADSFALELMAEILNGSTGRLYKSMIEGQKIASSASASTGGLDGPAKYAGFFSFEAEVKDETQPESLEEGWYAQLRRLQDEPVDQRELQKVKNRVAAEAYRRLQSNFFLMLQVGYFEGLGGWEYINQSPARLQAVTAEDIQRVARTYFDWKNRSVAIYLRREGSASGEPGLAGLDPTTRAKVTAMLKRLMEKTDPAELQMILTQMEAELPRIQQSPDQLQPGVLESVRYVIQRLRQRIDELNAAAQPPQ